MSTPHKIDTRGFSCPEPVLMVHPFLKGTEPLHVLVDAEASKENITRAAENKGWYVEHIPTEPGEHRLELSRKTKE